MMWGTPAPSKMKKKPSAIFFLSHTGTVIDKTNKFVKYPDQGPYS
jgi:hypothetical protein